MLSETAKSALILVCCFVTQEYGGVTVKAENNEYLIHREEDILGILRD